MPTAMTEINSSQLCDSASKAEAFGNIFKLNFYSPPRVGNDIITSIQKLSATSDLIDPDLSQNNIILQLSQMKPTNNASPGGIPSIYLKKLVPVIAKPLSIQFCCSYLEGKFPNSWKHTTIVLIFKILVSNTMS